jgi:hypothetical protein
MRVFAIAGGVLIAFSVSAVAADAPNMIGTWSPTEHSSVRIGSSPNYSAASKPLMTNGFGFGWVLKIEQQDGRSFAGTAIGPKGKPGKFVGVFHRDGKRFVYSTDKGVGTGEVDGDEMEFCWNDSIPALVAAACTVEKRSK